MRWSRLHGDMQGFQSKEVGIRPVKTCPDKTSSEIPCRVTGLPELGVIPANNRLITGKPSSYAARQGRRNSERVIPWEVDSSEFDPVTTDRPSGREIAVTASANPRLRSDAGPWFARVKG